MDVILQYHDSDVCNVFRGFQRPDRENILTRSAVSVAVMNNGCDGIVAVLLGGSLTLTMGTDDARNLAAELVELANHEDAKIN